MREDREEESETSKRFARGWKKFYNRYFTCTNPRERAKYRRSLWKASPGIYLLWIILIIVLIITTSSTNRVWVIIVCFAALIIYTLTEIWVLGAPEEKIVGRRRKEK